MIQISDLSFRYRIANTDKQGLFNSILKSINTFQPAVPEIIDRISIDIKSNTTTAIIGPSGCGKTTLLYLIAGLLPYEEGEIRVNSGMVNGVRKSTGIILQNYGLFPWKTIKQNILLGLKARGVPKEKSIIMLEEIIKELGIESISNQYPADVSGGQKQRAAIARTLVLNPDLLLMDEASSALDALTKETIQDLLLNIFQTRKTTMVFVTHSIEEAVFLGQNIIIMEEGKIKNIIDNKNVGMAEHRRSKVFYETCSMVRSSLEG